MSKSYTKPFFVLAPLDDVSDTVMRRAIHDCAPPDLSMTEFVNVDGLSSPGRPKLMPRLSTVNDKGKVIAQLWGKTPENFEKIADEIASGEIPGFVGIDLNFGCPEKSVVKNECCSALAQPELRDKAIAIIKATQKGAGKFPVSVKTRLGFDKIDYSWHKLLLEQNLDMLTVHVRTTREMSKVPAHWDAIDEVVRMRDKISPKTKIVLNGDVMNRQQGEELAKKHNVDGIMIGRGIFHDPFCFAKVSPWGNMSKEQKVNLLINHIVLFQKTYPEGIRKFDPLKKFAKVYINGFDGASDLRDKIMHCSTPEDALAILRN